MIDSNLTARDLQILKEHGIEVRITDSEEIEVLNGGVKEGVYTSEFIKAPFDNTKDLMQWLGY